MGAICDMRMRAQEAAGRDLHGLLPQEARPPYNAACGPAQLSPSSRKGTSAAAMSLFRLFTVAAVALLAVAVHSDAASVANHYQRSSSFRGPFSATAGSKTVVKREADGIGSDGGMIGGGAEAAKGGVDAAKIGMQTPIEMAKVGAMGGIQAAEKVQG